MRGALRSKARRGGIRALASVIGDPALRTVLAAGAGDRRQLLLAYYPEDLDQTKISDDGGEGD